MIAWSFDRFLGHIFHFVGLDVCYYWYCLSCCLVSSPSWEAMQGSLLMLVEQTLLPPVGAMVESNSYLIASWLTQQWLWRVVEQKCSSPPVPVLESCQDKDGSCFDAEPINWHGVVHDAIGLKQFQVSWKCLHSQVSYLTETHTQIWIKFLLIF